MNRLSILRKATICKIVGIENRYIAYFVGKYGDSISSDKYYIEGLISDTWQIWNRFCRELLIASCQGAIGVSGVVYPERPGDSSWQRIAFQAVNSLDAKKTSRAWAYNVYVSRAYMGRHK